MPNVKFLLKKPNSKDETLIFLHFRFDKKKLVYSTGEKIKPKFWNPKNQRVRDSKLNKDNEKINDWLDSLEKHIKDIYRELVNNGDVVTPQKLRKMLDNRTGKTKQKEYYNLLDYSSRLVKQLKNSKNSTWKSVQTTSNFLKEFSKDVKSIDYEDIDLEFYRDFTDYLKKQNFTKNYISRMIGNLKRIMNDASDCGFNQNMAYRSTKFKRESEEVYNIYLSIEELEKMHKHDFSNNLKYDRVCDSFLIGAFTGLRFSDFSRLKKVNIKGGEFVIQDMRKEAGRVIVPMHWIVKEILNKYDGQLPKPISNQKMNEYLKKIGEKAKINEEVIKTRTEGGVKTSKTYKKYELITTHTARRSMATNMYLAKVPIYSIMTLTGHKSITQFLKYIKITEEEIAQSLKGHEFFRKR